MARYVSMDVIYSSVTTPNGSKASIESGNVVEENSRNNTHLNNV